MKSEIKHKKNPEEYFREKIDRNGPRVPGIRGRCWVWTASVGSRGYGLFGIAGDKTYLAHRYAYERARGPIKAPLQIDHLCRNRLCVRPTHLELVTPRENVMRGNTRAAENSRKTHCPLGHAYAGANLAFNSTGKQRVCRLCRAAKTKEWRQRTGYKRHRKVI